MSEKPFLLGVDIGTNSAKGVLVHHDGSVAATHSVAYSVDHVRPGWAEHDADAVWWASFVRIVQGILDASGIDPSSIAAIGCSAIGITMLPVDRGGRPLRPSILYGIDTRALHEIEVLNGLLGRDAIREKSGSYLSTNSVGPKVLWFRNHEPELFAKTHKVLTASSYLTFKLTGRYAIDAYSAQGMAPMFDPATQAWDAHGTAPVCAMDLLPEICGPTEVIGTVTTEAARETGLGVGTPVIAGTVDAAAEAISVGVTAPGDTMLMLGSTAFITQVLDQMVRDDAFWSSRYLVPGTFALSAGLATSAAITRWFLDQFGQPELAAEATEGTPAYQLLAERAAAIAPGSDGLILLPYFSGERAPVHDPRARGMILGLTTSHTRDHIYRAILEGVAYSIRHNLELMAELGASPAKLVAVGGGTKNATWLQIIADCTGTRIEVPSLTIGASYGDAYLAGIGVGVFDGFDTLRTWIRTDAVIEPNPALDARYTSLYEVYRRCYPQLIREMHDLADYQARVG